MKKRNLILYASLLIWYIGSAQSIRPQTPVPPFNYTEEIVQFANFSADTILLEGTLTVPKNKKNPPTVILISGSGPQDRNETVAKYNHQPFLVLADYLTNHGIAVLRYDDRGVAASQGDFKAATTFDFASDVEAAMSFLKSRKDIDASKIGLIGHSEGGLIAPMVASKNKDLAFIVLLAAPGVNGGVVLQTQSKKVSELMGVNKHQIEENDKLSGLIYDVIRHHKNKDTIKVKITEQLNDYKIKNPMSVLAPYITPAMIEQQLNILKSNWMCELIRINPIIYLEKTTCPVLALNGSKDVQVLPDINLEGIRKGLENAANEDVTIKKLEGLNHLFQTAETGLPNEYKTIEETFAPEALSLISEWILERFN